MQLAMIGLGRMGANMVRRLIKGGHQCVVFDMSPQAVADLARDKALACYLACRPRAQAGEAARGVADGAGGGRGQDHRRPRAAPRARRYPHRRRQFVLRRRHPPRPRAHVEGDQLRGRRDQRRRMGAGARLLHDDRRTGSGRAASRSDLQDARPWRGGHPAHAGAREASAAPPSSGTCIAARAGPVTSSRWSTMASSTASWPPMPKE